MEPCDHNVPPSSRCHCHPLQDVALQNCDNLTSIDIVSDPCMCFMTSWAAAHVCAEGCGERRGTSADLSAGEGCPLDPPQGQVPHHLPRRIIQWLLPCLGPCICVPCLQGSEARGLGHSLSLL